jgi:multisubunit Na+/H+ antiporter MnhF subunit
MLGTLLVIALLLLLFGVIGGIAISKFLFFILIVAAVIALFGVLSGRSA